MVPPECANGTADVLMYLAGDTLYARYSHLHNQGMEFTLMMCVICRRDGSAAHSAVH